MKSLIIYPSTSKLAKKFLLPIIAIIALYIFIVVPDEDIGVGTGFFTFMTWFLLLACVGSAIAYFYQLKISKTKSVLSVNEEYVHFSRKHLKVSFSPDIVFMASDSNIAGPPTDAGAMDFLVDNKESFLYVWKNNKQAAKVRATFMNLDSNMIAALLNDINQAEKADRKKIIESFHSILTDKASQAIKERILIREED